MFKARTKAPAKSEKWFYASNPFYNAGYGLPNCTTYAWGRFAELLGKAPALATSNAENWYGHKDGYKRGKKPKLGAVIVWAKGKVGNAADGAGHVAIVEKIYSDGSFLVSESGWKAKNIMWTKKIPADCKRAGYTFLGFIYNPAVKDEPAKPAASKPKKMQCVVKSGLIIREGAGKKYKQVGSLMYERMIEVTGTKTEGNRVWYKCKQGYVCGKEGSAVYLK